MWKSPPVDQFCFTSSLEKFDAHSWIGGNHAFQKVANLYRFRFLPGDKNELILSHSGLICTMIQASCPFRLTYPFAIFSGHL